MARRCSPKCARFAPAWRGVTTRCSARRSSPPCRWWPCPTSSPRNSTIGSKAGAIPPARCVARRHALPLPQSARPARRTCAAPEPERALTRWERCSQAANRDHLFRLFELRPGLLGQVLRILTLAPPLADELARRPDLLDRLIDTSALDLPGDVLTRRAHGAVRGGPITNRVSNDCGRWWVRNALRSVCS